jgi:hypothetical protein
MSCGTVSTRLSSELLSLAAFHPAVLSFVCAALRPVHEHHKKVSREYMRQYEKSGYGAEMKKQRHKAAAARRSQQIAVRRAERLATLRATPHPHLSWPLPVWLFFFGLCEAELDRVRAYASARQAQLAPEELKHRRRLSRMRNLESRKRHKKLWKRLPKTRIVEALRGRIAQLVRSRGAQKADSTLRLTGCSAARLLEHLQNRFRDGMAWENYGSVWHVDHVRPCASFDLADPEQQRQCFHFSNLQPLLAEENIRKGATYV